MTTETLPVLPNTGDVAQRIMFAIEAADSPETWLHIRSHIDALKELVRKIDGACDERGLELVRQFGEFQCGTKRWYEGPEKKVKPRMKAAQLLNFLREKLAGDEDALERCLSSSAIKHGQARKELEDAGCAEAFDEAFETIVEPVLKDGKPNTKLKCIDERFLSRQG